MKALLVYLWFTFWFAFLVLYLYGIEVLRASIETPNPAVDTFIRWLLT